jgi:hypothetical protein
MSSTTGATPAAIPVLSFGPSRVKPTLSRGRFRCLATAHQAIEAHAPVVVRPGGEAPSDYQSEHRSASRRTSVRWSPGHGARRAENSFAALQMMPRSPHLQPAWRLPGRFTRPPMGRGRSLTSQLYRSTGPRGSTTTAASQSTVFAAGSMSVAKASSGTKSSRNCSRRTRSARASSRANSNGERSSDTSAATGTDARRPRCPAAVA